MPIPGSVPVSGFVAPTAVGDSYPSHIDVYGQGGFRTVADTTERDAITTERRSEGMIVFCIADGITYQLDADLVTWNTYTVAGILPPDVMLKSVYDPNDDGIVTNSDQLGSQVGAYYLARANHTGTQAQATIVNLVSDLAAKENIADIGTNGHAAGPLAGGLIPLAQLPPGTPNLYKGLYNATTNTPAILNGVGTAGDFYIANVIGNAYAPVNVTIVNQIVAYDGAVWQVGAVFSGGIASLTTNAGVQTGPAVTLNNTSYLVDSAGKRFVTDNIQAGLNASPNPVTAANPVATQADLTSLIVVGNGVFMPELFADGQTLGDGTLRTLASLGYNNTTAGNYWTRVNSAYTINVNTMSIDWIAIQEAFLAMNQEGYSQIISPGGRGYCPSQQLDLPVDQLGFAIGRRGLAFGFNWNFSGMFNFTGNDLIMMNRYFTNQSQISGANSYLLDYKYKFENFYAKGNQGSGLTDGFIRLGATCHSSFTDIETNSFGCPLNVEFALEAMFTNIKHVGYGLYGTKLGHGTWTGGTINNAGVNVVKISNHRCVNQLTPVAGLYLNGGGVINAELLTFEGVNGSAQHVFFDNPSGGGANYAVSLSDLYFETAGASRAAIRFNSARGDFYVNKWNNVVSPADMPVFVEAMSPPGLGGVRSLYVNLSNNCTDQDPIKLRGVSTYSVVNHQTGYGPFWDVTRVAMPNGSGQFNTATNFDISDPTYILPLDSQYSYTPSPI